MKLRAIYYGPSYPDKADFVIDDDAIDDEIWAAAKKAMFDTNGHDNVSCWCYLS